MKGVAKRDLMLIFPMLIGNRNDMYKQISFCSGIRRRQFFLKWRLNMCAVMKGFPLASILKVLE